MELLPTELPYLTIVDSTGVKYPVHSDRMMQSEYHAKMRIESFCISFQDNPDRRPHMELYVLDDMSWRLLHKIPPGDNKIPWKAVSDRDYWASKEGMARIKMGDVPLWRR